MTEAEWLVCPEPISMLESLGGTLSQRKLLRFSCACCRRIWKLLIRDCRRIVEFVEAHADKCASGEAVQLAATRADEAFKSIKWSPLSSPPPNAMAAFAVRAMLTRTEASFFAVEPHAKFAIDTASSAADATRNAFAERFDQAKLLRDIFGNPFRPVALDPAWLTEAAVGIARGIYDDRAFERMPILADALQDAGCENADILTHCREAGVHVRGCWVVDLVLGKS